MEMSLTRRGFLSGLGAALVGSTSLSPLRAESDLLAMFSQYRSPPEDWVDAVAWACQMGTAIVHSRGSESRVIAYDDWFTAEKGTCT